MPQTHQLASRHSGGRIRFSGWTLLEVLGVLAVLGVLSTAVLPALIRQVDRTVADQEVATLKTFANAFQQYVLTSRVIPDHTTWYSAIAAQLGFSTNDVLYNARQQSHLKSRVFLIDPNVKVGLGSAPSGLPYSQTNFFSATTSPMMPANLRVMIVSSLGKDLPMSSGSFAYFSDLWNATDGTIPSDLAWTGWTGSPSDVVVQRINLEPLFFHVLLGKYNSVSDPYYCIDPIPATTTPVKATAVDGYFLQGTVLTLYTNLNATDMDTKIVLNADTSYVFEQGIWRSTLLGASSSGNSGIGDLVQQFLQATPNSNAANPATNAQQVLVVNDMLSFMSNYNVWAYSNNFNNGAAAYTTLKALQPVMMADIQGLYHSGTPNYYPTNATAPCQ